MQDKVIKEAILIQNLIEDQSSRNLEVVNQLNNYVQSLEKSLQQFSTSLEEGVQEHLEDKESESPELQKLYTYLKRLVKELIRISKGVQNNLTRSVLSQLQSYTEHLETNNNKIYQTLCNHYKQTVVAYKMRDFKPDIQDIYNPIFKERDILNRSREKYNGTLKQFESLNSDYLQFTKDHLKTTIRSINELLMLDRVESFLSIPELSKALTPQPVVLDLLSEIEYELGFSQLLVPSARRPQLSQIQFQIHKFVVYLLSSTVLQFSNYQQTRNLILGNQQNSLYFIIELSDTIKTQINLAFDKYHDIQSMIKFIFASIMSGQQYSSELLINILRVASKIKSNNKWMLKELKNYQTFWKDSELWKKLYNQTKKSKVSYNSIKHYIRKIKKIYNNNSKWLMMRKFSIRASNNEQDIALEIIREISMYLASLEIENQFVIQLMIDLCKTQQIPRSEVQKLIKYQHSNKKQKLNELYLSGKAIKSEKDKFLKQIENQSDKLIFGVQSSLKFLSLEEGILQLRLVSKEWNKKLRKEIERRYLEHESSLQLQQKYRLKFYLWISRGQYFTQKQYRIEVSQVPKEFEYKQIISLDVKRSLQWNPSLQASMTQILSIFAHKYADTGYLQGMNYLVQHILKLTTKPHEVYKIFQYIMRTHYRHYYQNNFALIRLRIYQLVRLIEIYIPDLARHFQRQKIQGEYFLLPWAITLWGQFDKELSWIMSDGFIVDGWQWWMKVCLWLMSAKKQEFLTKRFQGIMKYFGQLIVNNEFNQKMRDESGSIRKEIQSINVTNQLLNKIQKQYNGSSQKIQQLLDS